MSNYQTTATKPDVYQRVTDSIITAIEQGAGQYWMPLGCTARYSWLKVLRADKRVIFTAASQAQKAADWLAKRSPVASARPDD